MNRVTLVIVIAMLLVPAQASAQFYGPFAPPEDYEPGVTVSGTGFAPRGERAEATARAVGDASARAASIASALNVSLGGVTAIETRAPFEPRRDCEPGERTRRCAALEAITAQVTFAIQGGPTSEEGAREISGVGAAQAPVDRERKTNAAIRHQLRAARRAATPDAANAARVTAEAGAVAAGTTLGPLFAVVEQGNPYYGYDFTAGSFGPGQFCRQVRRFRIVRDPETGQRRGVRGPRVLRCFAPRTLRVQLEVHYLGG